MGFSLLHELLPLSRLRLVYPTGHFFGLRRFLGYFDIDSSCSVAVIGRATFNTSTAVIIIS
jgi:hypothetical protein